MKKLTYAVLVAGIFTSLVGCGGGQNQEGNTGGNTSKMTDTTRGMGDTLRDTSMMRDTSMIPRERTR